MSVRQQLIDWYGEDMTMMDGYDDCIVGVCTRFGQPPIVAYDRGKVIQKLMMDDGMEYEEAEEFFAFNQLGAWAGEQTPCFIEVLNGG